MPQQGDINRLMMMITETERLRIFLSPVVDSTKNRNLGLFLILTCRGANIFIQYHTRRQCKRYPSRHCTEITDN
jgi:hypothetical protein